MLKIYRTRVIASGLTGEQVTFLRRLDPSLGFVPDGTTYVRGKVSRYSWGVDQRWVMVPSYALTRRVEFLRDHHIDGKTLARLLPAWAKVKPIKGIGAKVTEFYAENDKVVTDMSVCVGSDDWLIAQDDPFRAAHLHLFEKYGMYAEEFDATPKPKRLHAPQSSRYN